jgi:REP element-mobilizing transposase RayT
MEKQQRKSQTTLGKIYFWTATIHRWYHLIADDNLKDIIIASLKSLSDKKKITVYGFVIMPNHIHLIWRQNDLNGKESPKASFMKYTAHCFQQYLRSLGKLNLYKVNEANKAYEIWQRDSLGIEIYSRYVAKQKLNYIHANPVKGKWDLAKDDIGYYYSSAEYYETGIDKFGFLNNLFKIFDGE